MKAARLHAYHEPLKIEEVDEPKITGPLDVIVRIGAAGPVPHRPAHPGGPVGGEVRASTLPYTPGHENAGWVHEVGSGVTNVEVGDTVIVHPFITCGLCRAVPRAATTCTARTARSRASAATAASPSSCRPARAPWSSSTPRCSPTRSPRWPTPA